MGLLDSISNFYDQMSPGAAQADMGVAQKRVELAQMLAQLNARNRITGGPQFGQNGMPQQGPGGPISWNPMPQGNPNATLMGNNGAPDQTMPRQQIASLLGQAQPPGLLNGSPQDMQGQQQRLLAQAYPEEVGKFQAQMANLRATPGFSDMSPSEQLAYLSNPAEYGKAKSAAANEIVTMVNDKGQSISVSKAALLANPQLYAQAGFKQAAPFDQSTGMTVAEQRRHNVAEESLSNIDVQPDPTNPGGFLLIHKVTGEVKPIGQSAQPQPWNNPGAQPQAVPGAAQASPQATAPSAPAQAQPAAPGAQPQAPQQQPQQTAQAPAFKNDFINALPPDAQQRFAQLPPNQQPIIAGILAGATPPPPATGRSPQIMTMMQDQLRKAAFVVPNFNEQLWQARNEATKDMAASTPNSFGGQRVAAQTLIGHLTGLLDAAADNNNASSFGTLGNMAANTAVSGLSPGTVGNSATKKAALENFNVHKIGVGEEGTKVMSGSAGTDTAKADMMGRFSPDADISSTVGSVGAMADMMHQRVQSQVDKLNGIMGTNQTVEDWLGPQASAQYKVLEDISNAAKSGQPITPQVVKSALQKVGNGLPPGMVRKVGTYKGKPVYVDAAGKRHVDTGP